MPMVRSDNRKALLEAVRERYGNQPIVRQALLPILCLLFCVTILLAFGAFKVERRDQLSEVVKSLRAFNEEQVRKNNARFNAIATLHRKATDLFNLSLSHVDGQELQSQFDTLFPEFGDGTRRSSPGLYEGTADTRGGVTYGIGAFLGGANAMTLEDKRQILAAYQVVRSLRSLDGGFKSFFYFTPTNRLVVFAPSRHDRLLFYRRQAPANFDFRREEFVSITTPENNPARRMRCTGLQRIIYDRTGQTWTTGCMTPVDVKGKHVGAWGNSIMLRDIVEDMRDSAPPHAIWALVSADGRLIFHSEYAGENSLGPETDLDLATTQDPKLKALWGAVQTLSATPKTVMRNDALKRFITVDKLDQNGWYSVTMYPTMLVDAQAYRTALLVLTAGFMLIALQAVAVHGLLNRLISRPLTKFTSGAQKLAKSLSGEQPDILDFKLPTHRRDEIGQMARAFDDMAARIWETQNILEERVRERTRELDSANKTLRHLAVTDPMTGLCNRREFMRCLEIALDEAAMSGRPILLAMFDIDHFKRINDTYGHGVGDEVIVGVGRALVAACRASDICGRLGGEEFALVLPGIEIEDGQRVLERMREAIAAKPIITGSGQPIPVTVSGGLALWTLGETVKDFMSRTDSALYAAKHAGRNCLRLAA